MQQSVLQLTRAFSVVAALAVPVACAPAPDPLQRLKADPAMAELLLIQDADPARALEAAWRRGDKRFLGVGGFSLSAPGTDTETGDYDDLVYNKHGVRMILGTGDTMSKTDVPLREGAMRYAARYNGLLLRKLGLPPPQRGTAATPDPPAGPPASPRRE